MKKDYNLNDFRRQLEQLQKLTMKDLIAQTPGMADLLAPDEASDAALDRILRTIDAMTDEERSNPDIIDDDRVCRIAESSATSPREVAEFLNQFAETRATMRGFLNMNLQQRMNFVIGLDQPLGPEDGD